MIYSYLPKSSIIIELTYKTIVGVCFSLRNNHTLSNRRCWNSFTHGQIYTGFTIGCDHGLRMSIKGVVTYKVAYF